MRRALLALLLAAATPAPALGYGWPVRPFDAPHAIRGYFDDPRVELAPGELSHAFHFGVDIAAPDGTPVYAVEGGTATPHRHNVAVTTPSGRIFGYWHIDPSFRHDQEVRAHELLGRVAAGWGHVHFAESLDGEYLNPLRPGALEPYVDRTPPRIASILILGARRPVDLTRVAGVVDLEVDAYDVPEPEPSGVWSRTRVTPALVRWRVVPGLSEDGPWQVAFDARPVLLPDAFYSLVYAPGTKQNRALLPGRYRFYLEQGWDSRALPDGFYRLEVSATDVRGNTTTSWLPFRIANE